MALSGTANFARLPTNGIPESWFGKPKGATFGLQKYRDRHQDWRKTQNNYRGNQFIPGGTNKYQNFGQPRGAQGTTGMIDASPGSTYNPEGFKKAVRSVQQKFKPQPQQQFKPQPQQQFAPPSFARPAAKSQTFSRGSPGSSNVSFGNLGGSLPGLGQGSGQQPQSWLDINVKNNGLFAENYGKNLDQWRNGIGQNPGKFSHAKQGMYKNARNLLEGGIQEGERDKLNSIWSDFNSTDSKGLNVKNSGLFAENYGRNLDEWRNGMGQNPGDFSHAKQQMYKNARNLLEGGIEEGERDQLNSIWGDLGGGGYSPQSGRKQSSGLNNSELYF